MNEVNEINELEELKGVGEGIIWMRSRDEGRRVLIVLFGWHNLLEFQHILKDFLVFLSAEVHIVSTGVPWVERVIPFKKSSHEIKSTGC